MAMFSNRVNVEGLLEKFDIITNKLKKKNYLHLKYTMYGNKFLQRILLTSNRRESFSDKNVYRSVF